MRRTLFIMVKEPRPGRVKTRLGRDIGMINSAWWFRHQTDRLIRRLSADPRWDIFLAVSPDVEGLSSRVWPRHLPRWAQGGGDLGHRMSAIFKGGLVGPIVIIGGDIPGITPAHIARAFDMLGNHDAVFGPAPDGGFWLIGMKRMMAISPRLFKDVRWSSKHALADTLATMHGLSTGTVATLRDVDTIADLQ